MSKYEKFTPRVICRALIANAPYNPRMISDEARGRLKKKIKKSGLVEPLIWNESTGNLVGGHQRLSILDELEGRVDYDVTVAAVRLDPKEEKALNVFLNNQAAMGHWDEARLEEIITELKEDGIENLGFDIDSLEVVFDDKDLGGLFADENDGGGATVDEIKEIKERREDHVDQSDEAESGDHYAVIVFESKAQRDLYLEWCGLEPGNRFVRCEEMTRALEGKVGDGSENQS